MIYTEYPFTGHLSRNYCWPIVKYVCSQNQQILMGAFGSHQKRGEEEKTEKL